MEEDRVGLLGDLGLEGHDGSRSSREMTIWMSSEDEKSRATRLFDLEGGVSWVLILSGRAGRSFDADLGRCLSGGVAILDEDAEDEDEEDRLRARGDGGGRVSSEAMAGEVGKGGTGPAIRCLGVDLGLLRDR